MGADIHLYVERFNGNEWVNIDNWRLNPDYDKDEREEREWEHHSLWNERNYSLFTILAGVQDNCGNEPITPPRGLPEDASEIVKSEYLEWGLDAHTASWLTLPELWHRQTTNPFIKERGMVSKEAAAQLSAGKNPDSWCQWSTKYR